MEFVDHWEREHVRPVTPPKRADEARRLALQCRQDAAKAGINDQDLDAAVDGDLIANMVHALDAASLRQMAKEQWAGDE